MKNALVAGFSKIESLRIETHLTRLLPYLTPNRFIIVGGLAIRYHLTKKGIPYPSRPFNDLDIIAESIKVISPKIVKDFLVEHYHPPKGNSFYLVLVDPLSKTKIDIFDYQNAPKEVVTVKFGKYQLKVQSAEDQLIKTVLDLQKVFKSSKVDPKQFEDARLLLQIVDLKKIPPSLIKDLQKAEAFIQKHPEYLQEKPFRKDKPFKCSDCSSSFLITSMEQIIKILGYVE